ncbi:MAG: bifunctional hydroxymethylpyrimidine kinase/phosphomethylpyrimidine kinase [Pseudomonadota bacterium]
MSSETAPAPKGRVLIIAGSDNSGGAGIQADIKSVTACGGYAMTAISAITVQDTVGVHGVFPIPLDVVLGQAETALADIGADAIKTGMLADAKLIGRLAELLAAQAGDAVRVIDPVMVATSGDRLVERPAVEALTSDLIPGAGLVTPNAPEAEILSGKAVESVDGQRRAAEALLEKGALGALVKGGHLGGDRVIDVLQTHHGEWIFEAPRIDTTSTHGTGCTLASAIATHLALGSAMPDAVEAGRDYLIRAIETAPGFGRGHGPVNHGWPLTRET